MPYNPGVTDISGQFIGQGISTAGAAIGDALRYVGERRRETKELRSALSDAYPENKEQFSKMNLEGLRGYAQAQKIKADQQQQKFQIEEQQNRLAEFKRQAVARTALATALRQAQPQPSSVMPLSFQPGNGSPLAVSVPGGTPSPDALVSSVLRNPAALETPVGASVLADYMKRSGQWNLKPGDIAPIPGTGYTSVPVSPSSREVIPTTARTDTTKPPPFFDLGGGRKGYWQDAKTFKVINPQPAKQSAGQSALSAQLRQQLGGVLADLDNPDLDETERKKLETRRDRLARQLDEVEGTGQTVTPAKQGQGTQEPVTKEYDFTNGSLQLAR